MFLCLCACSAPTKSRQSDTPQPLQAPAPEVLPWTRSFEASALLIADEVRIEGPRGLMDHIATRIEPEYHSYSATTLPEGFQQVFETREEGRGMDLRAYLDGLEVVAFERLVLLERPGDVPVVVEALGEAFWREAATGREQRAATLRFEGRRPE
jgi:hypothetical protein